MDGDELTRREERAWLELRSAVDRLPPERRERPGVNVEGWTVKDVLWHVAHWWDHLTGLLGEIRDGTYTEPPDDDAATDAENARVLEASRGMALDDVERGMADARARLLAAWAALPEVTEPAERWFVWETIEHYEEHLPGLLALADA
jgi:hypothetical protein